jgi:DNA ligase D-like protein (predicted 3'-phosphoesterase)
MSEEPVSAALRFVVQQHDATAMHYDFRLEAEDGTLKSWAVPRGPSLDPSEKRLAMRTGDHELDYIDYEGVLSGVGAGPVIVWDEGTFENLSHERRRKDKPISVTDAVDAGHVSFRLAGHKLVGAFALTRTAREPRERWILVKKRDDDADARRNVVGTAPESVKSGRTIDEVRASEHGNGDGAS